MPCGPCAGKALSLSGIGLIGSFCSSNVLVVVSSTLAIMSPVCDPGVIVVPAAAPPSGVLRLTVTARPAGAVIAATVAVLPPTPTVFGSAVPGGNGNGPPRAAIGVNAGAAVNVT